MPPSNPKPATLPSREANLSASIISEASIAYLQHGDLPLMAGILARGACRLSGAKAGALYDLAPDNRLRLLASHPEHAPLDPPVDLSGHLALLISAHGSPWPATDLAAGITNVLLIPLQIDNHPSGALGLANRPGGFDQEARGALQQFAGSVAQLLHGIRNQLAHLQTRDELRQAQKMEALGYLAAGIAHDFNNMLTIISGYTSLLAQDHEDPETAREHIGTILEASERAAALSRQLLAFSRCQMLKPEPLLLNTQIERSAKLLSRIIGEDIAVRLEFAEDLPLTRADPGQLEQILMNLAINARDAMPDGGELIIRTGQCRFDAAFLELHKGSRPGDYTWFAVTDSGTGMSAQVKAEIFQPFYTTKRQGKGTGLGLATVYGIVKQSGGYITVDSSPGNGSCFTVYLPRTDEQPAIPQRPSLSSRRGTQGLELLVVEDDSHVLAYTTRVLQREGFCVHATSDPGTARELFQQRPDHIALLVTDMVMPNLSGPLLARSLRSLRPGLPVLFVSGYGQVTFGNDFTCGEPGAFLAKPFTSEQLLDTIEECLAGPFATPRHP